MLYKHTILFFILLLNFSVGVNSQPPGYKPKPQASITCGADRLDQLLPLLNRKRVAMVVNQTSLVNGTYLVDTLLSYHIIIQKIFAPEHGFRGAADAGANISDSVDAKTNLPVISIYGKKKKPSADDLKDVDVVIFDIQDVGVRCYTFISSLHYLMEACADNSKELIVLDRPNPNGWYVDGPVLKKEFQSFVGVDPIPVVHGLTVGEYAQMVNGEGWLPDGKQCKLKVITCLDYTHKTKYDLPVKPSPNLPNYLAVSLYPSLCFFEGTNISVGRGTLGPFQMIGSPKTKFDGAFQFTPGNKSGATNPPFVHQACYGLDLRKKENWYKEAFTFQYVIDMYTLFQDKDEFFLKNNFFDKLCGTDEIRKMIIAGKTEPEIKASYRADLLDYIAKRKKYLLYEDFE